MVNCKNCGQAIFRTIWEYKFKNIADGGAQRYDGRVLGYHIPFYFCSERCKDRFADNHEIEKFPQDSQ